MLKKRFFKTKKECEVTFELTAAEATQVELFCEANGWQPIEMKRSRKGPFRTKMRFPKARRFEFRYRIDRQSWVNDESADAYHPNGHGGRNSVLETTHAS